MRSESFRQDEIARVVRLGKQYCLGWWLSEDRFRVNQHRKPREGPRKAEIVLEAEYVCRDKTPLAVTELTETLLSRK